MIRCVILFGLVGPYLGALGYWADLSLFSENSTQAITLTRLIQTLFSSAIFAFFSYFAAITLGFVPAAITGISYWCLLFFGTKKNPVFIFRIIIGGILGTIIASGYGYILSLIIDNENVKLAVSWPISGSVAGALCAWLFAGPFYMMCFPERDW